MNRRGFLGAIIAAGAAPAIVRADSLMRIVPRDAGVLTLGEAYTLLLGPDGSGEWLEDVAGKWWATRWDEVAYQTLLDANKASTRLRFEDPANAVR